MGEEQGPLVLLTIEVVIYIMFDRIERICETCGEHFFAILYRVKKGQARFCSRKCYGLSLECRERGEIVGSLSAGKLKSEEHKRRIGEGNRGNKRSDLAAYVHRMAVSGAWKGKNSPRYGTHLSKETKDIIRNNRLAYIARTPIDERRLSEDTKAKLSEARKRDWQNPEYVAKLIKAMGVKPNKSEQILIDLLAERLPQFKYNGDFSQGVMLGGLTPDFVNVNGKKQVIEFFGDYWHSPEIVGDDWRRGELGKIMIYNSVGFRCLVIWEHELKELTEEQIVEKISNFSRRRY